MIRNKRRGGPRARRLFLEGLEQRSMLAGSVFVEVEGSTLKIKGDNDDNSIIVSQLDDDTYVVVGFDDTAINFDSDPPIFITDEEIKHIEIDMKRGDDLCVISTDLLGLEAVNNDYGIVDPALIQDLIDFVAANGIELEEDFTLEGKLDVDMNDGADTLVMVGCDIEFADLDGGRLGDLIVVRTSEFGNLWISNSKERGAGDHSDVVEITQCLVEGTAAVKTAEGDDTVLITLLGVAVLDVNTGSDSDIVDIDGVAEDEDFEPAKKVSIVTGAFGDQVFVRNVLAYDIYVDTGAQDDQLTMNDVFADRSLIVKTGAGADTLAFGLDSIIGVGAEKHFYVDTGAGNDVANLQNIFGGELLQVLMGAGNDTFVFSGEADEAFFDGGRGENFLEILFYDIDDLDVKRFQFADLV